MASLINGQSVSAAKITKARGKMVKPILKKLSHSERNSLDLDRGWDEQQIGQLETGSAWETGMGYSGQARDVSFGFGGPTGLVGTVTAGATAGAAGHGGDSTPSMSSGPSTIRSSLKLQHGRSGSQTSAGSGPRTAFVHPFAQTPRTSTPPLSYANSLASFDNGRDCSPTITETEDDVGFDAEGAVHAVNGHAHMHSVLVHASSQPLPAASSQSNLNLNSNLRRPSLNSQRTASFPETPASKPPSLRINTGRSVSVTTTANSSRLAHGSLPSPSQSDLHIDSHNNLSISFTNTVDSPTGSLGAGSIIASPQQQQPPQSQLSPLRTSLDMAGFPRLRSRSEMDTATRVENIRAARRKFEEREREKEEKYDREMIRKRERRDNKEASRIEKGETPGRPSMHRKKTPTVLSTVSEPDSKHSRPSQSTTNLGFSSSSGSNGIVPGLGRRRHTDSPMSSPEPEKHMGFAAHRYDSVTMVPQTPPNFGVDEVCFDQAPPRRGSGAKRKTQGYWHGFLLWLRTKLLRMSTR
ncbi:hypothetical protein B0J18DRAFT_4878 [Chaetomium sp. MPI-SDFR-AT-0129]|nr:hypothetical protein B0J18DRAFT_4878 [Chaetomium sp. MPI-SDFR-AT-0129]